MSFVINVPSRNRSEGLTSSHFYNQFGRTQKLKFFVRMSEVNKYHNEGLVTTPVPDEFTIAQKRALMLQLASANNYEYLFISDDDIKIDIRRDDDVTKFRPMEPSEALRFIDLHLSICSETYPIVHPILRMHGDKKKYMYELNCPAIRFVCYHVPTFIKEGVQIDGMQTTFMSDRYAQLCLLDKGYNSVALAKYCVDDKGTNAKGGCSDVRTPELQSEAAKKLSEAFPNNVSLRVKQGVGKWKTPRLDCTIQWKKFLRGGQLNYVPKEEMEKFISGK